MPDARHSSGAGQVDPVEVFAALGDPARLRLIAKLSDGAALSISQLAKGSALTRQAITKHLRVLENAGLACSTRSGRESLYRLETASIMEARQYLESISRQWDAALGRLRALVEE